MNDNHKELISIGLSIAIVLLTFYIVHRFLPSMIWASIIVIATFPLYRYWRKMFGTHEAWAALSLTVLIGLFLLLPLSWLVTVLVQETQLLVNYIQDIDKHGGKVPEFITNIPFIGLELEHFWEENMGKPGLMHHVFSNLHLTLAPASYYAKQIGLDIAHRGVQLGFTLISLFFFYRDGEGLIKQINDVGEYCLGGRWHHYAKGLPSALRSTVNGTILVGLGVGFMMGICYAIIGFPAPTLFGFITALASMIPFLVPIVFIIVDLVLFVGGHLVASAVVLAYGTLVMFVADHFIKPTLIGGAIKLPFLAVLFGILGGVETLGLLGLFLGPIIMVLFITLWQEPQLKAR